MILRRAAYCRPSFSLSIEDGVTKNLHYLYAPTGLFAIFAKSANNTEVMIQIAFSRIMLSDN